MANALLTTVQTLIAEKQRLATRERGLITTLNRVLAGIGYTVIARGLAPAVPRVTRKAVVRGRRKPLTCPHCDRRFAQAVHLGRHMAATHKAAQKVVPLKAAAKARRKRAAKAATAKPAAAPAPRARKAAKRARPSATKVAVKAGAEKPTSAGGAAPTK